ncbi:MAG: FG-GAP repeat protein, partial [Thermoplasmata archaeon]|nr:FG-GAP repeat protein [Thermoplasmata archaeon]
MDLNQKQMKTTIMTIFTIFLMIFSSLMIFSVSNQNGPDPKVTNLAMEEVTASDSVINDYDKDADNNIQSGLGTRSRYLEHTIHLDDPAVQLIVQSGDAYDTSYGNNIRSGTAIAAGDIDNDGFEDLILGCPFADGALENRWNTGQVLVFFGGTQTHPNTIFDQAKAMPGEIDITIHGADNNDLFGGAVVCGNVDGDAYDDIIITAPYGDSFSNSRNDAGEVYVIFGAARDKLESVIDLRTTEPDILIFGARAGDRAGFSVALGDVMGDSKLDIITGAKLADPEGRTNAGMVYIIAGNTRGNFGKTIDLDVLTGSGRGSRGNPDVRIDGVNPNDRAGFAVAAGDVNGDGRDDVLIGARYAQYNSSWDNTGVTYVIYGQQTLPSKINLTVDADVYIYGRDSHDNSGWALATGDINGD